MNFDLTEEQRIFRDEVIRFAERELMDDVVSRDREGSFDAKAWRRLAEFGIHGLPVAREYGGQGADPLTVMIAMEALGYGYRDNGLLFSLNAQMWACQTPIARSGTDEQKRRYLPGLCDGSLIAAHGMSEPNSGSDAFALTTTAERVGDDYILNGSKIFVTNAPVADLFVVFGTTDRSLGFAGLCAFLIERDTPGLTVGSPIEKMGLRTSPMAELFLDGCRVPATHVLGKPGAGMAMFNSAMEWERSCILATTVGTMQRQLERTVEYARERKQFGQPIGKFQSVANRIVDMKVRLETAQLLLYKVAWLKKMGKSAVMEAALAKLYLSECFVQSGLDAIRTMGGYGYTTEYEVERDFRDSVGGTLYSGTSDIQRNIIARLLGL